MFIPTSKRCYITLSQPFKLYHFQVLVVFADLGSELIAHLAPIIQEGLPEELQIRFQEPQIYYLKKVNSSQ